MAKFEKTINVNANSILEASTIGVYLQTLAKNLSTEALAILAEKSSKPGIESKLKSFKNLI